MINQLLRSRKFSEEIDVPNFPGRIHSTKFAEIEKLKVIQRQKTMRGIHANFIKNLTKQDIIVSDSSIINIDDSSLEEIKSAIFAENGFSSGSLDKGWVLIKDRVFYWFLEKNTSLKLIFDSLFQHQIKPNWKFVVYHGAKFDQSND